MKNELAVTSLDRFCYPFLKKVGVVGIDVTRQVKNQASLDRIDFLQPYFQAVVFFDIESVDDFVVVCHMHLTFTGN